MNLLSISTAAALAFTGTFPLAGSAAPDSEVWARVKSTENSGRHGRIEVKGDKLTLTESNGTVHVIDPDTLISLEFEQRESPPPNEHENHPDGGLRAPWKSGPVGALPRGGSAMVRDGRILIETSAPDQNAEFGSFYSAYRQLPKGDSHITARVSEVKNYHADSRSGIMIRDGVEPEAKSVFLALSQQSPATFLYWENSGRWSGSVSEDSPVFCSDIIRATTPRHSTKIDVDIAGARKLFLVAQGGPDGIVSDWADWAEPKIFVGGREKKLTDLDWVAATSDYGTVTKGKSAAGGDLKIDGKPVAFGIGSHANSLIEFNLPPGTTRFRSTAGIDQGGGLKQASIRFMVFTERPRVRVAEIRPNPPELFLRRDSQRDSRPGRSWLRLVRQGGRITGYLSPKGKHWREIGSVRDRLKPVAFAALAAQSRRIHTRWTTAFEHVDVGAAVEIGRSTGLDPEIVLTDGTVFHGQIQSATPTLVRLGGAYSKRIIPEPHLCRIKFHHSSERGFDKLLNGRREGIALSNSDFFEGKLIGIEDGTLTARSPLFGERSFDLTDGVAAWVLRPQPEAPTPPHGRRFRIETWNGARLFGNTIRTYRGGLAIDTARLGVQKFPMGDIRRLAKVDPTSE